MFIIKVIPFSLRDKKSKFKFLRIGEDEASAKKDFISGSFRVEYACWVIPATTKARGISIIKVRMVIHSIAEKELLSFLFKIE